MPISYTLEQDLTAEELARVLARVGSDDKKAAEIAKLDLDAAGVEENLGYYEFLRLLQDRSAIASTLGAHQTDELK